MNLVECINVSKSYDNHIALNNVSIQIPEGSIYGLLGPNGAGKSTLIRIINQITAPDSGKIIFNNHPIAPADTALIGYLPEERGLYKKMKVSEQTIYLAQLKGLSKTEAKQRLKQWFARFDIEQWWNKRVEELSKGMQQKIQFITTILHNPKLLIFDEPFSGFDPINTNLLKELILELRNQGTTIIFSTHNMNSVEEVCDHIALINKSEKILDGAVADIRQKYKLNSFELNYIGDPNKVATIVAPHININEHRQGNINILKGTLKQNYSYNQLLTLLLPEVDIVNFNDVLPSMNDIFIKCVNQ